MNSTATKFDMSIKYVRLDGWRGYREPIYAVAGANDTGMFSDSPCPSDVNKRELNAIRKVLRSNGIRYKSTTLPSSNVFCMMRFVVVLPNDVTKARELVKDYLNNNDTQLAYIVE